MIAENMQEMVLGNSVIRSMFEEGKKLKELYGEDKVFDFSLGNPNLPPPIAISRALFETLDEELPEKLHGYMSNAGFDETRKAVADDLNGRYGTHYDASNVIMTAGAAMALNIALRALLDIGDEVIVFAPYFVEYSNYIGNYKAKTIEIRVREDRDFLPDPADLERAVTPRTKAVIVNSPNNPTGVVYPKELLASLAEVLKKKEDEYGHAIYIISDEPYRELIYDETMFCHIPGIYDDSLVCYSYSKSMSLPGDRIGYLLVPSASDEFEKFRNAAVIANRISGCVNAPSVIQLALARALNVKGLSAAKDARDFYGENGRKLFKNLIELGYECLKPQGAFYLWVKVPGVSERKQSFGESDKSSVLIAETEFVNTLRDENILVTPGSAFACPGYVRIAYCASPLAMELSKDGFKRAMEKCR